MKDKILHPLNPAPYQELPVFQGNVGNALLERMKVNLSKNGDFVCLINGFYSCQNQTEGCGVKNKLFSNLILDSCLYANAFWKHGLRKGDVVHFQIPNCTDYHCLALAVWACEGIASLADPGLSPGVLKSQLEDTNAKFILCYRRSRKTVLEALKLSGKLGHVKVIMLEKADLDQEDFELRENEEEFMFFQDFVDDAEKLEQPPLLQNGPLDDDETVVIFWSSGTTGNPKGIQHTVRTMRFLMLDFEFRAKLDPKLPVLLTTCFFHIGGFMSILEITHFKTNFIFNNGYDLDQDGKTCQAIYKQIDAYRPWRLVCGSHHCVQLTKERPLDKNLNLDSVLMVLPMGSTVPESMYEDLKPYMPNLALVCQGLAMT